MIAYGGDMLPVFVELKKVWDSIPINKLWMAMEENNILEKHTNAVKRMFKGNMGQVKAKTCLSETFVVNKGLRQGSCLLPTLCSVYLTWITKELTRKCQLMEIQVGDGSIYKMLFEVDQVVLEEDEDDY